MNNIKTQILEKIKEYSKIIIHRHINPDPDALGSQGGLQKLIQGSFPDKQVFVVGEEIDSLKFLIEMDKIKKDTHKDVYKDALVIVCDTATKPRISQKEYVDLGSFLIMIDHHPQDREIYGQLQWIDTSYSSTCEMIMDLYLQHKDSLHLTNEAARLLYAGIIGDTERFLFNNTKSRTMQYAAKLLDCNFDPQEIYSNLYRKTKNAARLNGKILSEFDVTENGVAYFKIKKEMLNHFDISGPEAAILVNTMKDIDGNKVWVLFIEYPEEIRVRIRSAKVSIKEIAQQFNGGGHPLASGATVHSWVQANILIQNLDELCKSNK